MQRRKLRTGLLVDGPELPAWAHRMIEIIKQSEYAEIALVVQNTPPPDRGPVPLSRKIAAKIKSGEVRSTAIRLLLTASERFLVGKPGDLPDASKKIDSTDLFRGVDVIKVCPRRHQFSDYIEADDLARIQARDIDVLIRLGFRILRGDILRAARYGVWSYHHGDNMSYRGGPHGYWEVMESSPETGSMLQILSEDLDNGRVLYRSFSATHPMSLEDNRSNVQWKALHFIPRKLKELYEQGEGDFFARVEEENAHPIFYDRRLYTAPTNVERCILLWKKLLEKCKRKWRDTLYRKQWFLLFDIGEDISTSLWRFKYLMPPKDRDWADPFIVSRAHNYYIFIEEYPYATRKGHISVIVMSREGTFAPPVPVLKASYHLSYPFVFMFENEIYMIPESRMNRTIDLYKCVAFPYKWQFEKTLMKDCGAADTTLCQWQSKWWMFVNQSETREASSSDELFLYYSDTPLSNNWTPHPRNPIVSDTKSARPAGRLFVRKGRLYRPSQNCSGHYGRGLNISEITRLTETEYEEKIVSRVEPKWDRNVISTHTLNYEAGLTIVDGQRWRRR